MGLCWSDVESLLDRVGEWVLSQNNVDSKIDAINRVRLKLSNFSQLNQEPVDCVLWIKSDLVIGNDYNPNNVAPPEMLLLQESIMADGYTQPIVAVKEEELMKVVDGFHRSKIGKTVGSINKKVFGHIPVAFIRPNRTGKCDRMASTVRHNRARGKHSVDLMASIVSDLSKQNWSDEKIGKELGMEPDEVLRLKQITGLAELFADQEFSEAWE